MIITAHAVFHKPNEIERNLLLNLAGFNLKKKKNVGMRDIHARRAATIAPHQISRFLTQNDEIRGEARKNEAHQTHVAVSAFIGYGHLLLLISSGVNPWMLLVYQKFVG
jgi:hypothetical protein